MYEMLVGYPPFCSETPQETYRKIINWKHTLRFPEDCNLSPGAKDLIQKFATLFAILMVCRLLCDQHDRLGKRGVEEIMQHPFFAGVDWKNLRRMKAPIVPELKDQYDTRYFDHYDVEHEDPEELENGKRNHHWPAFTYKSPALRRLALGTWGRGTLNSTLKLFQSPFNGSEGEKENDKE